MIANIMSGSNAKGSLKPAFAAKFSHSALRDSVGPFVVAAVIPSRRCVWHLRTSDMADIARDADPLVYGLGSPPLETCGGSKRETSRWGLATKTSLLALLGGMRRANPSWRTGDGLGFATGCCGLSQGRSPRCLLSLGMTTRERTHESTRVRKRVFNVMCEHGWKNQLENNPSHSPKADLFSGHVTVKGYVPGCARSPHRFGLAPKGHLPETPATLLGPVQSVWIGHPPPGLWHPECARAKRFCTDAMPDPKKTHVLEHWGRLT